MTEITHVCLSDMHFGADNSLLTKLGPDYQAQYREPSEVLLALVDCLRDLLRHQRTAPTLVLAGDILEMALSRTNEAAMAFEGFMKLIFAATPDDDGGNGRRDLFQRHVMYVPGNHDHHLWETAREDYYIRYLKGAPADQPLGAPWHVTRLLETHADPFRASPFLSALLQRNEGLEGVEVRVAYPNLGLITHDHSRGVVFTHGHYVEPLYTLMTRMHEWMFPEDRPGDGSGPLPPRVEDLEEENFAWIDFFWSAMGRSGVAGEGVQKIYEMLGNDAGQHALAERLAAQLASRFDLPVLPEWAERGGIHWLLHQAMSAGMALERGHQASALSEAARAGLTAYVNGPLRRQIRHELGRLPQDLTVIFGHTHKPFEELLHNADGQPTTRVLNTGGWVVDTVDPQTQHGSAIVLVDEALNTASLRMHNEHRPEQPAPFVHVEATEENPLRDHVIRLVEASDAPWSSFRETVSREVTRRAEALVARTHTSHTSHTSPTNPTRS